MDTNLIICEEVDEEILTQNIYHANNVWKEHWCKVFTEMFKDSELYKELQETLKERNYLASKINGMIKANEILLKENIKLGQTNEKLTIEVRDLRKKVGSIPSGFFDAAGKLVKKNMQNHFLNEENKRLKEKAEHPLNKIEPNRIEEVLRLRAIGLNYDQIAEKTGVSKASISRYVSKNKERLKQLENSLKSNLSS